MDIINQNRKALIIDDNEDIRIIFSAAFEDAGYKVYTSKDGLWGITDVIEVSPTVIILDIMMPEMSGYDFLENLKNNTSIRAPVIVVSNLSQDKDKQEALDHGADLCLTKSDYSGQELVETV
ncbi:MAG: response regulator, partial [Patescibacteria group bacterium]